MIATRAAIALVRTALAGAGQALDLLEQSLRDDRDELVSLAKGCDGIKAATLIRWAGSDPPRLRAFEAERGRLVAWRSDIRRAIEAKPVDVKRAALRVVEDDEEEDLLEEAIANGEIVRGGRSR